MNADDLDANVIEVALLGDLLRKVGRRRHFGQDIVRLEAKLLGADCLGDVAVTLLAEVLKEEAQRQSRTSRSPRPLTSIGDPS